MQVFLEKSLVPRVYLVSPSEVFLAYTIFTNDVNLPLFDLCYCCSYRIRTCTNGFKDQRANHYTNEQFSKLHDFHK